MKDSACNEKNPKDRDPPQVTIHQFKNQETNEEDGRDLGEIPMRANRSRQFIRIGYPNRNFGLTSPVDHLERQKQLQSN
jgi:hypothetical protein